MLAEDEMSSASFFVLIIDKRAKKIHLRHKEKVLYL